MESEPPTLDLDRIVVFRRFVAGNLLPAGAASAAKTARGVSNNKPERTPTRALETSHRYLTGTA